MATLTINSDFEAQENKICHCFHCFPIYLPRSDGIRCHDLRFLNVSFKPAFLLSSFTFIKGLFSSSSLSAIRVVSSAYLSFLIFLPAILIPACASSSLAFLMIYSLWSPGECSPWNSPDQNTGVSSLSLLQGIFPTPGIKPRSPTLQANSLPAEPQGKPKNTGVGSLSLLQWIFLTQESN